MRVAVIVVSMSILVVATPSQASDSCMSKTEAREHFGSVHIYWHGPDHCWDARPMRHRQIVRGIQRQTHQQVLAKNDPPKDGQPRWRDSMSELLADDDLHQTFAARAPGMVDNPRTSGVVDNHDDDIVAVGTNWSDRWVDIDQVAPPRITVSEPKPVVASPIMTRQSESMVTAPEVAFVCVVIILTLGAMEVFIRRRGFA